MLKNIKSIYFVERLFTYVDDKDKLDIIKYNKNIQKILDISLINYKFFSKRYIIYEKNGKGKEYDKYSDKLMFEGEYINGKRNGKGIEYYDFCNLTFEGEYLNGKKWNGDGYDDKHNIVYSLKDGKGLIKKYDINGSFQFEGEYLKGEINGKVKEYYNGDLIFEGEYLYGNKYGKGKEYNDYSGKLKFEGEYINGKRNGKGIEYNYLGNIIFEGEYLNGERWNGNGKEYNNNGNIIYEGEYLNGEKKKK